MPLELNQEAVTVEWCFPVSLKPQRWVNLQWSPQSGCIEALLPVTSPKEQEAALGLVALPGFINLHTHLEQWRERPIGRLLSEPFAHWLHQVVAYERSRDETQRQQGVVSNLHQLLATGTTTVVDNLRFKATGQALSQSGLRVFAGVELLAPKAVEADTTAQNLPIGLKQAVQTYEALKPLESALFQVGIAPHAIYNVSPSAWAWVVQQLNPAFALWHLAESPEETAWLDDWQASGFNALHQQCLGASFPPALQANGAPYTSAWQYWQQHYAPVPHGFSVLAHGSELQPEAWQALKKRSSLALAHCPRSNLALHGRTLPADYLSEASAFTNACWGLSVKAPHWGLGTDGRLSTPTLDLREEALTATGRFGWTWPQTLEALTWKGAKALGMGQQLGHLAQGAQADFTVWRLPESTTTNNPEAVLAAVLQGQVTLVASVVAGHQLV
jgi:cytosine/adenosine deaminase-related metal-dependent hydrolase